jgi:hypothetical protein
VDNPFSVPSANPDSFGFGLKPFEGPQRINAGPNDGIKRVQVSSPNPHNGLVPVTAPHWYAGVIELFQAIGTASVKVLDIPPDGRNMLMIRNASTGTQNLFIGFGRDANALSSIVRLTPNTIILFDTVVPQNDIYAVCDAAGGAIALAHSTINRV